MSRAETMHRLRERTAEMIAGGVVTTFPATVLKPRPAPALARPLPCADLGPRPRDCACGGGIRTCTAGEGTAMVNSVPTKGVTTHAGYCQTCESYVAKEQP